MTRERVIVFVLILLVLLAAPMTLPYLLGGLEIPLWADLLYVSLVLLLAGVYLLNRLLLIDRFLIRGRIGVFAALNLALLVLMPQLQGLVTRFFESFAVRQGIDIDAIITLPTRIAQYTLGSVLCLLTILAALAAAFSDAWRRAAFRYREVSRDKEALEKDIDALRGQLERQQSAAPAPDAITVKVDLMLTRIPLDEILYVRSDGDYIVIARTDGSRPMTLMTLKALEKQLPADRFCRVHRSWLVNIDRIGGLKDGKILVADTAIPLADSCKPAFFELLSRRSILLRPQ